MGVVMRSLRCVTSFAAGLVLALTLSAFSAQAESPTDLDQGWNKVDQEFWYDTTQGSRLIPWSWFQHLEQPDSDKRFLDKEHMSSFRYLQRANSASNPLPVGFVIDQRDDSKLTHSRLRWKAGQGARERWVGMNCSACHTAELTYREHRLRVDGGPTLADFQSFVETLNRALVATRDDEDKFHRFAAGVLGSRNTDANQSLLGDALVKFIAWQQKVESMNQTPLRYGFARLDAFGNIYNRTALLTRAANPTPNPPDAPASYPFLWNTPQHDRVQWNGIAENTPATFAGDEGLDVGALGRNTGQVIGVFGDVAVTSDTGLTKYFESSMHIRNMVWLENLVHKLRPPKWPDQVFGKPDAALAAQGRTLFGAKCATCHLPLDRRDLTTRFKAKMSLFSATPDPNDGDGRPPGTDIWMACNAYTFKSATGVLAGTPSGFFKGDKFKPEAPLSEILTATVTGTLMGQKGEIIASAAAAFFPVERGPEIFVPNALDRSVLDTEPPELRKFGQKQRCEGEKNKILGYKARPLTGIWATPPYLHNGSVPTLYDLLLPEGERPKSFYVGSREYDPVKAGYETAAGPENTFLFETRDGAGNIIDGNSNAGHDYGNAALTEQERRALVEYLKTL